MRSGFCWGRVQPNAPGQTELKLKTQWRDGTFNFVISALEVVQRLAALVPRRGCSGPCGPTAVGRERLLMADLRRPAPRTARPRAASQDQDLNVSKMASNCMRPGMSP